MHATARGSIAHNFLKLKEGGIYSVKNFVVLPNKDEFWVIKNATFMLEFDGATTIRKVFVQPDGFIRFPFQLVDFEQLETTNNKYLIDATGGQSVRVTLWGSLGELLLKKRTNHVRVYAIVLTCQTVKQYNSRLYLSSTSSTLILDDEEIPEVKQLKSDSSGAEFSKELPPVGCSDMKDGTLENLLMWSRNRRHDSAIFQCIVLIDNVRTNNGWNFPSCGGEDCKKSVTQSNGRFLCESCNKIMDYPVLRYRLKLEVSDDTAEVVVVLFNEMATNLVKCTADSIVEYEDQGDEHSPLRQALANIVGRNHTLEFKSMDESGGRSMAGGSRASETPEFKRMSRKTSVTTPSKVNEGKKQKRHQQGQVVAIQTQESTKDVLWITMLPAKERQGCSISYMANLFVMGCWLVKNKPVYQTADAAARRISIMFLRLQGMGRDYTKNHSLANILQNSVRIQSNAIIRQDGRVQSYCGLQLKEIGTSIPRATTKCKSINASKGVAFTSRGAKVSYHNIGAPSYQCVHYNARMWYEYRNNKGNRSVNPSFSLCCQEGKIQLPKFNSMPQPLHNLLNYNDPATTRFRDQIRVYNGMFSFTSFGARIDHSINNGRGVYTFRVNGQSYHRIGSLLPKEGTQPSLVAKAFRMARDWCHSHGSINVELHLLSERTKARQYNKTTIAEVAALITNDFGDEIPSRDIIVNKLHSGPKRISELHPAYMALQYPLLFPYGEDDFHDKICYYTNKGAQKTNRGFVTMKDYYSYIIHQRDDQVTRGDTNAAGLGQRIVLPGTFVGGPRYMMQNYQDAMALCTKQLQIICYMDLAIRMGNRLHAPQRVNAQNIIQNSSMSRLSLMMMGTSFTAAKTTKHLAKRENVRNGDHVTSEKVVAVDEINNYLNCRYLASLKPIKQERFLKFGTGIAALLLPGGRTAHSRFVIPLELLENSTCGIKQNTHLAELMQEVKLIIWDEAPMTQKYAFEALDKTLRDILGFQNPEKREQIFRGMTVLLGGDFRQILPVIPKGKRPDVVQACINRSELWKHCNVFMLTQSMRVNEYYPNGEIDNRKQKFNQWVLSVGNGIVPAKTDDEYLKERVILTPRNDDVDEINTYMFNKLAGKSVTYNSADEICKASTESLDQQQLYPTNFLNTLNFSGMPPHALCLKKELPIMLLRNVNPTKGLCNGTRLIITELGEFVIHAKILTGSHVGDTVLIHQIIITSNQSKWPFVLKRRKYLVKPCYAMTINKSQGQSLNYVGLYLHNPVFSHGQLYR
ncbi:ATP-dependent DNA helicase PIF1-like protein [Tanacetum coccineum]